MLSVAIYIHSTVDVALGHVGRVFVIQSLTPCISLNNSCRLTGKRLCVTEEFPAPLPAIINSIFYSMNYYLDAKSVLLSYGHQLQSYPVMTLLTKCKNQG